VMAAGLPSPRRIDPAHIFFFFQSYNWDPTHRGLLVPELIFQYNIGQLMGC